MALTFNKLKGEAQKGKIESYTYVEGDNTVRLVGDVCARYVYWLKGENDKNVLSSYESARVHVRFKK